MACNSGSQIDPRVLTVPSVSLQLPESNKTINIANSQQGKPTVVLFFSPDCKYSQRQIKSITANYTALKDVHFYMCSSAPIKKLHAFSEYFHLNRFENITVGRDVNLFFDKELKVTGYPWSFIYTADKKLKRIATGEVSVKFILDMVKV
jgi:hypothetical protein